MRVLVLYDGVSSPVTHQLYEPPTLAPRRCCPLVLILPNPTSAPTSPSCGVVIYIPVTRGVH